MRTFLFQGIYFVLTLALTCQLQVIQKKFNHGETVSIDLFWSVLSITMMVAIFEGIIGVITTLMLQQTGVKNKCWFYLGVWTVLISYILLYLFQAFLYVNGQYFDLTQGHFNTNLASHIASACHEALLYLVMFFIIFHTNRINLHTLMMFRQVEEQEKAKQRKKNRRTANFCKKERPKLDSSGRVVETFNPKSTNKNNVQAKKEPEDVKTAVNLSSESRAADLIHVTHKSTTFRALMSQKLGVEVEHEEMGPLPNRDDALSAQTDQMIDGYDEACDSPEGSFVNTGAPMRHGSSLFDRHRAGSLFQDQYLQLESQLKRKISVNSDDRKDLLNNLVADDSDTDEMDDATILQIRKQQVMETLFLDVKRPYKA